MYPLLALSATLASWFWLMAPRRGWGVGLGLTAATAALLASHHVGLFVGAALGVAALVWPRAPLRARLARSVPLVAGLLLYSPWLWVVHQQWSTLKGFIGWNLSGSLLLRMARVLPFVALSNENL